MQPTLVSFMALGGAMGFCLGIILTSLIYKIQYYHKFHTKLKYKAFDLEEELAALELERNK